LLAKGVLLAHCAGLFSAGCGAMLSIRTRLLALLTLANVGWLGVPSAAQADSLTFSSILQSIEFLGTGAPGFIIVGYNDGGLAHFDSDVGQFLLLNAFLQAGPESGGIFPVSPVTATQGFLYVVGTGVLPLFAGGLVGLWAWIRKRKDVQSAHD
jgi:hypothetical protein